MNKNSPVVKDNTGAISSMCMTSHKQVGGFLNFHRFLSSCSKPYNPYKNQNEPINKEIEF